MRSAQPFSPSENSSCFPHKTGCHVGAHRFEKRTVGLLSTRAASPQATEITWIFAIRNDLRPGRGCHSPAAQQWRALRGAIASGRGRTAYRSDSIWTAQGQALIDAAFCVTGTGFLRAMISMIRAPNRSCILRTIGSNSAGWPTTVNRGVVQVALESAPLPSESVDPSPSPRSGPPRCAVHPEGCPLRCA